MTNKLEMKSLQFPLYDLLNSELLYRIKIFHFLKEMFRKGIYIHRIRGI